MQRMRVHPVDPVKDLHLYILQRKTVRSVGRQAPGCALRINMQLKQIIFKSEHIYRSVILYPILIDQANGMDLANLFYLFSTQPAPDFPVQVDPILPRDLSVKIASK